MAEEFLTSGEEVRMTFRAHWRSGLVGISLTLVLGVGGLWMGMWIGAEEGESIWSGFFWAGLIGLAVGLGLAAVAATQSITEWLTTRYWVTNERLIVRTGFFTKSGKEIPVDAINSVAVRQGPFERMLGYGDMSVESAGANSLQVFKNVPDPTEVQKSIYDAREERTLHLSGGSSAPSSAPSRGKYDDLADLAKLRDDGVISPEEFEAEKTKLLASSHGSAEGEGSDGSAEAPDADAAE